MHRATENMHLFHLNSKAGNRDGRCARLQKVKAGSARQLRRGLGRITYNEVCGAAAHVRRNAAASGNYGCHEHVPSRLGHVGEANDAVLQHGEAVGFEGNALGCCVARIDPRTCYHWHVQVGLEHALHAGTLLC